MEAELVAFSSVFWETEAQSRHIAASSGECPFFGRQDARGLSAPPESLSAGLG